MPGRVTQPEAGTVALARCCSVAASVPITQAASDSERYGSESSDRAGCVLLLVLLAASLSTSTRSSTTGYRTEYLAGGATSTTTTVTVTSQS
eukprot:2586400-Rhodomonas_salina.7